jgi:ribosomal protein S18 acetylase RimI-like enzyme
MKTFKSYLTENDGIRIDYVDSEGYGDVEGGADPYEADSYAANLAKRVGLGITRDRDLIGVAMDSNEMVGAIWSAFDGEVHTFDIAVEPKHQTKGIGSKLIDYGINNFDGMDYPEGASLEFDVTSPISRGALERRGFHVDSVIGKDRWIMKR